MNRSSLGLLSLSKAITGFVNFKMAEGLSHRSVDSYQRILEKWVEFSGDKDIGAITHNDITQYLGWLRTDYIPQRFNNKTHPLSPKTLRNIWITLSSFFTWAKQEFQIRNPMKGIPAPRFPKTPVRRVPSRSAMTIRC